MSAKTKLCELTPRPVCVHRTGRPPPRMVKSQPTFTEPWIDYSDSQVPPSDNGLYHLTLSQNNRYVLEAK